MWLFCVPGEGFTNISFTLSSVQMAAEEEIQRLKSQLREREEQVHQAAQAGLDLLNQQMDLQNRLDEQRVEMTNALEVTMTLHHHKCTESFSR